MNYKIYYEALWLYYGWAKPEPKFWGGMYDK